MVGSMRCGVCCTDALGWRVVRARWATCLPSAFDSVIFANPEDFGNPYLRRGFRTFAKQLAMRRAVRSLAGRVDRVIVASNGEAGFLPLRSAAQTMIYGDASHRQLNDLYRFNRPEAKLRNRERQMRRLAAHGAHFVGMSRWCSAGFEQDYQVVDCATIGPPMDTGLFPAQPPRSQVRRVLFVGGDFKRKGGEDLLAVAAQFTDLQFDIVSPGAPEELPPNVLRHIGVGPQSPELLARYANADAFVFPTHADCSPLAVLEAQASGLPVLCTSVGGLGDMVSDGVHGWVFSPGDRAALHAALAESVAQPEVAASVGQAGRQRVERENALAVHAVRWRTIAETMKP